jgi:voltage-gated potassium channel
VIGPLKRRRHLREIRREFLVALREALRVVWPIVSGLLGVQLALGVLVSFLERWPIGDAVYFTFVTGLTIGYGDRVPRRLLSRLIAIAIGFFGVLLTALIAAVGVRALQAVAAEPVESPGWSKAAGPGSSQES